MSNSMTSIMRALLMMLTSLGLAAVITLFLPIESVYAQNSPMITVGRYNVNAGCVDLILGTGDIDSYTRDAMAGEVYSTWSVQALKANSIMIRTVAMYYYNLPQSQNGWCNSTGQLFHLNTFTWQGWGYWGHSASPEGLSNNIPSDRVTDTGGVILKQGTSIPNLTITYDCAQTYAQTLSQAPYNYNFVSILTATNGVYGQNRPANIMGCASTRTNLNTSQGYSFSPSMTNGTVQYVMANTTHTAGITGVGQSREAEVYYGYAQMDQVVDNPFGQIGRYMKGFNGGDRVEYKMDFGGAYSYLYIVGIADIPGPVELNIYIDGYYKGKMRWNNNNNLRHLNATPRYIPGYDFVTMRRIAIEFANDGISSPCSPISEICDRNFFIDSLAALNTGS